jgi:hypothetical protein
MHSEEVDLYETVSPPWIKSKVATRVVSNFPSPSNRCWSFFFWQYDIAAFRTVSHSTTLVPMMLVDIWSSASASLIQRTQFQPCCPCLMGTFRSTWASLSLLSILAIRIRTMIIRVGSMVVGTSSNSHSDSPPRFIRSRA